MEQVTEQQRSAALRAITSALSKSEKALPKLTPGTFQHTTTAQGIAAYNIAIALLQPGPPQGGPYTRQQLEAALGHFAGASARVEKVLPKFAPGSPQHTLATRRLAAFALAARLIGEQAAL